MTKCETSQEWLEQASLLLKAYPTTTKVTTKYNVPHPSKASKSRKRKADDADGEVAARPATLEVRAYDPDSGVVLKYSTNKQQDVGRLIASLGRLGRHMAALPEIAEDTMLLDTAVDEPARAHTPVPNTAAKDTKPVALESKAGQGGGGGGKKKKKGKK